MAVPPGADLLHPSTSLEWQEWPLPVGMIYAQSVWLNDTLFVGGGYTSGSINDVRLYSFKPGVDTEWSSIDNPSHRCSLVAHNSQLLLVGGFDDHSRQTTKKIFTLRDGEFVETLPPMMKSRYGLSVVSTGSVLVVAGGVGDSGLLSSVEFLEDGQWKTAPSLPSGGSMSSALDGDQWYLIHMYDKKVYSASLSSLLSEAGSSPWKTLPDSPNNTSAAAFFGSHLLSIGGDYNNPTTVINAFSTDSQSWEHVADLPIPLYDSSAIVLPTGELVIIGGKTKRSNYSERVFRAFLKTTLVDPDVPFSTVQLFKLHQHGVDLIETLSKNRFHFHVTSGVSLVKKEREKAPLLSGRDYVELVFKAWERSKRPTYPATWEGLFTVLRKMDLAHLIQPIAKIVTGTVPELETGEKSSELTPQDVESPEMSSDEQTEEDDETPEEAIDRLIKVNAELVNTITQLRLKNKSLEEKNSQLREGAKSLVKQEPVKFEPDEKPEQTIDQLSAEAVDTIAQLKLKIEDIKPAVKQEPFDPTDPDYQSTSSALNQKQQEVEMKPVLLSQGELSSLVLLLQAQRDALDEYRLEIKQLRAELEAMKMERTLPLKSVEMSTGVREQETGTVIRESDQSLSPPQSPSPAGIQGLRGVEVAGRVTVEVTSSAQSFSWDDHGFNLHIPQDSLPTGLTHCTLDVMSSTNGHYQPPDDHELLSPVFWVRPTSLCRFQKPLTLEIQHCAKMTSTTELTFVRALCSQEKLPYQFKEVKEKGSFSIGSSFGSLDVYGFSSYAIAGKRKQAEEEIEKLYFASFFYHSLKPSSIDIYFAVALDQKLYHKKVKDHFEAIGAVERMTVDVEFEGDRISLDIPQSGVKAGQWSIKPLVFPLEILKKRVEFSCSRRSQRIQYRQLIATIPSNCVDFVPACTHPITLVGARSPNLVNIPFDDYIPSPMNIAPPQGPPAISIEQLVDDVGISKELLDRPVSDLYLAQVIAPLLSNWRQYAVALGLSEQDITAVDNNELLEDHMKTTEVLYLWKKTNPSKATFTTLVGTCLRERDNEPAKRICGMVKKEFLQSSSAVKRGHPEQERDTEPPKRPNI